MTTNTTITTTTAYCNDHALMQILHSAGYQSKNDRINTNVHVKLLNLLDYKTVIKLQLNEAKCQQIIKAYINIQNDKLKSYQEGLKKYRSLIQKNQNWSYKPIIEYILNTLQTNTNHSRLRILYNWDCYKTLLFVLMNQRKSIDLYETIIIQCCEFLVISQLKNELKQLCYIIINKRYKYIENNQSSNYSIKLNSSKTLNSMFKNRLNLLKYALSTNLCYISLIINQSLQTLIQKFISLKIKIDPSLHIVYYKEIARLFWKTNNCLEYACCVYEMYQKQKIYVQSINKKKEDKKQKEHQKLMQILARCMLSALLIADKQYDQFIDDQIAKQYQLKRWSKSILLQNIIKELNLCWTSEENICTLVMDLYNLVINSFDPLGFTKKFINILDRIKNECDEDVFDINIYIEEMQKLGIITLLQQLSKVYQSIPFEKFKSLSFNQISDIRLQKIICHGNVNGHISVQICHSTQMIRFCMDDTVECDLCIDSLSYLGNNLDHIRHHINNRYSSD